MKRLISALKQRPIITSAFLFAVVFTCLFAVRATVFMIYWADPDHRDQTIEDWMTPRFVARSWDLPSEIMVEALQTNGFPDRRKSLHDIAAQQGISFDELKRRIEQAAAELRNANQ